MSLSILTILYFSKLVLLLFLPIIGGRIWYGKNFSLSFTGLFFLLLISLLGFTSCYAIWCTGFQTIHLGFLFLFLAGSKWLRKEWGRAPDTMQPRPLFLCLGTLLAGIHSYAWAVGGRIRTGEFPFVIPVGTDRGGNDINFYGFLAQYLSKTGEENYFHVYNLMDAGFHGAKPYHYLELWLGSGITEFLGGATVLNLSLVAFPFLYALVFIGFLAIWEQLGPVKWYHLLVSISFFYLGGVYLTAYGGSGFHDFGLPIHSWRYKISVIYVFLLGFGLSMVAKKPFTGVLCLIALPLATIVVAPVLYISLGGWLLLGQRFHQLPSAQRRVLLGILFGTAIYIAGWYSCFGGNAESTLDLKNVWQSVASLGASLDFWWIKLRYTLWGTLEILVLYAPFWLGMPLLLVGSSSEYKALLARMGLLYLLVIFFGSFVWNLFFHLIDAAQLHFNLVIPFSTLMACLLLIGSWQELTRAWAERKRWLKVLQTITWVLLLLGPVYLSAPKVYHRQIQARERFAYSDEYLAKIQTFVRSHKNPRLGGALKGRKDYRSLYGRRPSTYTLGYYLGYMKEGWIAVSLSDFEIPASKKKPLQIQKDISSGIFFHFVQKQKAEGTFHSIAESQRVFVERHKLCYLIISRSGQLPKSLEPLVLNSWKDAKSGETFVVLTHDESVP